MKCFPTLVLIFCSTFGAAQEFNRSYERTFFRDMFLNGSFKVSEQCLIWNQDDFEIMHIPDYRPVNTCDSVFLLWVSIKMMTIIKEQSQEQSIWSLSQFPSTVRLLDSAAYISTASSHELTNNPYNTNLALISHPIFSTDGKHAILKIWHRYYKYDSNTCAEYIIMYKHSSRWELSGCYWGSRCVFE